MDESSPDEVIVVAEVVVLPSAENASLDWQWSWPARTGFLTAGVIMPLVCFVSAAVFGGIPVFGNQRWQSGTLRVYTALLLAPLPSLVFYPLLLYSMTCLVLLTFAAGRFARSSLVRFGIYTGVVLAAQYLTVLALHMGSGSAQVFPFVALGLLGALAVGGFLYWLSRKFRSNAVWFALGLAVGGCLIFISLNAFNGDAPLKGIGQLFGALCLFCLFAGTPAALAAYGMMALWVWYRSGAPRGRITLLQLFGVVTWISAYCGAWRVSLNLMLQEYATLPAERPSGCYIATAAARGHGRLVGACDVRLASGRVMRVNDQLRYLKCAELMLAHAAPRLHRALRVIYDTLGPRAAKLLICLTLADLAYLALKPAEWTARLAIRIVVARSDERQRLIESVYGR